MFGGSERARSVELIKREMSSHWPPTSVRTATEVTNRTTLQNRHTTYSEHVVSVSLHSILIICYLPFSRQVFDFPDQQRVKEQPDNQSKGLFSVFTKPAEIISLEALVFISAFQIIYYREKIKSGRCC